MRVGAPRNILVDLKYFRKLEMRLSNEARLFVSLSCWRIALWLNEAIQEQPDRKTTVHGVHNHSSKDAVYMQVETFGRGQTPTDRAGQPAELAPPFVFLANTAGVPMLWVLLVL